MACYDPAELTYDLSCPVCFEDYDLSRLPKLLNCRHTFCVSCIVRTLKKGSVKCCICSNIHTHINNTDELIDNYVITNHLRQIQEKKDEEFAQHLQRENDKIEKMQIQEKKYQKFAQHLQRENDKIEEMEVSFDSAVIAAAFIEPGLLLGNDLSNKTLKEIITQQQQQLFELAQHQGTGVATPGPSGISTISHNPPAGAQMTSSLVSQDDGDLHQRVGSPPQKQQQQQQQKHSPPTPVSTYKHQTFVSEPVGDKDVRKLPGVGEVLGKQLTKKGFNTAHAVLMQFLVLKKDEEAFTLWLNDTCKIQKPQDKHTKNLYHGLSEYCLKFL